MATDKIEIDRIRDILMNANGVICQTNPERLYAPVKDLVLYHASPDHLVTIDFNRLAEAIYFAGYRRKEEHNGD